jgi:phosphonate degradation associated HDIG domain protein
MHPRLQAIVTLFRRNGNSQYGGEAVTQLEHALQAALLAEQQQSSATLVAAALLHDVGHLLHHLPDDAPDQGIDDRHEQLGARYLARYFVREMVDPVRLHVASKRYLCTTEPQYAASLSAPSLTSLQLQGGKMNDAECTAFEAEPSFADAVKVRRWDDEAKVPGLETPPLEHYLAALESSLLPEEHS